MWGSRAALPAGPGQAEMWAEAGRGREPSVCPWEHAGRPDRPGPPQAGGPGAADPGEECSLGGSGSFRAVIRCPVHPGPSTPSWVFPPDGFATATQRHSEASLSWRGCFPLPVGKAAPEGADVATVRQSAREVSASRGRSAVIPVSSAATRQSLTNTEAARRNPQPSWGRSGHRVFLQPGKQL